MRECGLRHAASDASAALVDSRAPAVRPVLERPGARDHRVPDAVGRRGLADVRAHRERARSRPRRPRAVPADARFRAGHRPRGGPVRPEADRRCLPMGEAAGGGRVCAGKPVRRLAARGDVRRRLRLRRRPRVRDADAAGAAPRHRARGDAAARDRRLRVGEPGGDDRRPRARRPSLRIESGARVRDVRAVLPALRASHRAHRAAAPRRASANRPVWNRCSPGSTTFAETP